LREDELEHRKLASSSLVMCQKPNRCTATLDSSIDRYISARGCSRACQGRPNLGVRHCINCVSHAAVMMGNCRDRSAVFCACLSCASSSILSFHALYTAINQSINQSCSVHDRRPQTRQQRRPHWWLWRERRRRERDDLLSVRLAPHAIQSLITTRTSNCDYSFLLYTSVYTIHHTSVFANSPGHARHPLNKHD
jgi:hypothetical protein